MSEEEILEIIEKLQCEYKEQQNDKKYNDYTVFKAKEYSKGLQGLLDLYNKEKEKNKKIEDKIKGKINNLEIFRKTLPIRATEIERFIGELKDLLEE